MVTAPFLIKREDFSANNKVNIRWDTMSESSKMSNDSAKARTYHSTKTTTHKAPTLGLEHIIVKHGEQMKPGSFKTMMESMTEHMAEVLNARNQYYGVTKVCV